MSTVRRQRKSRTYPYAGASRKTQNFDPLPRPYEKISIYQLAREILVETHVVTSRMAHGYIAPDRFVLCAHHAV